MAHHTRAAQIARSRYSFEQAVAQLRHALDLLRRLPAGVERDAQEIGLQAELITSVFSSDGPGAAEIEEIAVRIDALAASGETTPALLTSMFASIGLSLTRSDLDRAEQLCERALRRASTVEWGEFFAKVSRGLLGFAQYRRGRLAEAIPNLTAGTELPLVGASGMMEPATGCASDLGMTLILAGELRRGLDLMQDADARADATGHPPTIVYSSSNMMRIGQILSDRAIVERVAVKMGELGDRLVAPRISAYRLLCEGWQRATDGHDDGVTTFREGWQLLAADQHLSYGPFYAQQLAAALLRLGRVGDAHAALDEAFALLETTQARWCEPELHRMRGEIVLAAATTHRPRTKAREEATRDAEKSFRRAIEVAEAQGARWWELRACLDLARLRPSGKQGAEALRRLRALHADVDDGSDVADLAAIRELLNDTD